MKPFRLSPLDRKPFNLVENGPVLIWFPGKVEEENNADFPKGCYVYVDEGQEGIVFNKHASGKPRHMPLGEQAASASSSSFMAATTTYSK